MLVKITELSLSKEIKTVSLGVDDNYLLVSCIEIKNTEEPCLKVLNSCLYTPTD